MTLDDFAERVGKAVPQGTVTANPGGGTSEVTGLTDERISYVPGSSTISVKFADLHAAYESFRGRRVTSSGLKQFAPAVFDSSARPPGHSCNCTFLFGVLERAGLASDLSGSGGRGDPYAAVFTDR